jgi:hypothetical protein
MTDLATPELKRCSTKNPKWQCKNWFPVTDKRKRCERCRANSKRYDTKANRKESKKRYQSSEKYKDSVQRYNASEKGQATRQNWAKGEKRKKYQDEYNASDAAKESQDRYWRSDKGKANWTRANKKPIAQLSKSLYAMLAGTNYAPTTFPSLGVFANNEECQAHFESTFEPWMNWGNQGKRLRNMESKTAWQIGHRIPKSWYTHADPEEQKKAWSRANLFAQCAVENGDANNRNLLSRDQWLALKAIWPKQCDGVTDEEAWAWARDNVDNTTRAAARAAEAGPSDLGAAVFSTDDDDSEADWF